MVKKTVGGFATFLLLSILAPAQTTTEIAKAGSELGALEGTLRFCSKVDPQSVDKYKQIGQLLTNGQSDEVVTKVRDSKEYKDALEQTTKQLEKLPAKQALAACKGDSAGKK